MKYYIFCSSEDLYLFDKQIDGVNIISVGEKLRPWMPPHIVISSIFNEIETKERLAGVAPFTDKWYLIKPLELHECDGGFAT